MALGFLLLGDYETRVARARRKEFKEGRELIFGAATRIIVIHPG
jgi:hypothetical protein